MLNLLPYSALAEEASHLALHWRPLLLQLWDGTSALFPHPNRRLTKKEKEKITELRGKTLSFRRFQKKKEESRHFSSRRRGKSRGRSGNGEGRLREKRRGGGLCREYQSFLFLLELLVTLIFSATITFRLKGTILIAVVLLCFHFEYRKGKRHDEACSLRGGLIVLRLL